MEDTTVLQGPRISGKKHCVDCDVDYTQTDEEVCPDCLQVRQTARQIAKLRTLRPRSNKPCYQCALGVAAGASNIYCLPQASGDVSDSGAVPAGGTCSATVGEIRDFRDKVDEAMLRRMAETLIGEDNHA